VRAASRGSHRNARRPAGRDTTAPSKRSQVLTSTPDARSERSRAHRTSVKDRPNVVERTSHLGEGTPAGRKHAPQPNLRLAPHSSPATFRAPRRRRRLVSGGEDPHQRWATSAGVHLDQNLVSLPNRPRRGRANAIDDTRSTAGRHENLWKQAGAPNHQRPKAENEQPDLDYTGATSCNRRRTAASATASPNASPKPAPP